LALEETALSWLGWQSLGEHGLASLLGGLLDQLVALHSVQELLSAATVLHVLDAHVDSLGDNATTHKLVQLNTDGTLGNVPDSTSLAMVELVGHALLLTTITMDIDNLADMVSLEVHLCVARSVLAELLLEEISGL